MLIKHNITDSALVQKLLDVINTGDYQLGERLPSQRELAKTLNVSRNSLREAVKVLETLDVLEIHSSNGMYLKSKDFQPGENLSMWIMRHQNQINDLLSVREALELKAVELIPLNEFNYVGNQLQKSLQRIDMKTCDVKEFYRHDIEFHNIIRKSSGNDLLIQLCSNITKTIFDDWLALFSEQDRRYASLNEHEKIAAAFCSGNLDETKKVCMIHFRSTMQFIEGIR